jgi:hypothetical protein
MENPTTNVRGAQCATTMPLVSMLARLLLLASASLHPAVASSQPLQHGLAPTGRVAMAATPPAPAPGALH